MSSSFHPNWASVPGETIADILNQKQLSLQEFAHLMQSDTNEVNQLLHGYISITDSIAEKLSKVLGGSSYFWLQREDKFRKSVDRLKTEEHQKWLNDLPIKDMIRFGWIESEESLVENCLQYFAVPNVWAWRRKYSDITAIASFRKSNHYKSSIGSLASWVRHGEVVAESIECNVWDAEEFAYSLNQIKPLTRRKDPRSFLPLLNSICNSCGVAIVVSPTPIHCTASGAAKFLSSDKALIMLSLRFKTDDHFWFTFFHEAGHLLLHGKSRLFIDEEDFQNSDNNREEKEANEFSAKTLIPDELQNRLLSLNINDREIKDFANAAGVSLGIVIGQLQHLRKIPFNRYNKFKRKFGIEDFLF